MCFLILPTAAPFRSSSLGHLKPILIFSCVMFWSSRSPGPPWMRPCNSFHSEVSFLMRRNELRGLPTNCSLLWLAVSRILRYASTRHSSRARRACSCKDVHCTGTVLKYCGIQIGSRIRDKMCMIKGKN